MRSRLRVLGVSLLAAWCLFGLVSGTGVQFRYSIVDLGTFGGNTSVAWGLNNNGVVVGGADAPDGWRHAFRWESGQILDLGNLGGTVHYEATDISDDGIIVGYSTSNGNLGGSFIWQNGQMSSIQPANRPKIALGVNGAGEVVGQATFPPPGGGNRAFVYQNGTMTDLGTFGGMISIAWDINDAGQVTGNAAITQGGYHAFLWENGVLSDLGTLGGTSSGGLAVNDGGLVAGNSKWEVGTNSTRAFVWDGDQMIDFTAGHFSSSDAWGINSHGQITGNPGYFYDPIRGFVDLEDSLTPNPGWSQLNPRDINDAGQIVGTGTNPQGFRHAFLMSPLPPIPAASAWTLAVAAAGLVLAGSMLLRRKSGVLSGLSR